MRNFLKKLIKSKEKRAEELRKQIRESDDVNEVRSLGDTLTAVLDELREAQEQLESLGDENGGDSGSADSSASNEPANEGRSFNPLATYSNFVHARDSEPKSIYGSLEYRKAFMSHVQRGTPIPEKFATRAGGDTGTTVTADVGAIVPDNIMDDVIREVSKVYGQIYSKVRKLNVKGGVKFPISKLKATFKWISETTVSNKQKAGDINEYVEFSYNIGEIRVAQTLLSQIVSLESFESEIVRIMVEAYVEMMDKVIISGTGVGQPLGITVDPRVTNVVEMSITDMADWVAWRQKLFANIPLSKRGTGEFLFPASTVESYLLTMRDNNERPLFREATEGTIGNLSGSFFGRDVTLVEPDVIADFDTAAVGDIIGIYWVPGDYAINTNLEFGMKRYFDEDTNEWINKGLTIVDGKILDTSGCYLIKKGEAE